MTVKRATTTWSCLLERAMAFRSETLSMIIHLKTPERGGKTIDMDAKISTGYGVVSEEDQFTAWTNNYVYWAAEYDGKAEVRSIERNP